MTDGRAERTQRPCTARARIGDEIIAESKNARWLMEPGHEPVLGFPEADVAPGSRDAGSRRVVPGVGDVRFFDPDRVILEIVDAMEGSDPRDVTIKVFPPWGDAQDLVDILEVEPKGPGRYRSVVRGYDARREVVEGSQMLAQALMAAGQFCPGRRAVSAHLVFCRVADPALPMDFELDQVSHGRTLTTLAVTVLQGARRCASGTFLLDVTAGDILRHSVEPPKVRGPYECEPFDMAVVGRDIRVVDGAYRNDPDAPTGPPVIDAWVRWCRLPDHPTLHAALLAQFTGHMSIAAAMRPYAGVSQSEAHRTLSTAVNAIALSIHAPIQADKWVLYHHEATFAGDGMTHSQCRVHDEAGSLLASFGVDSMVRAFADPTESRDERRAL